MNCYNPWTKTHKFSSLFLTIAACAVVFVFLVVNWPRGFDNTGIWLAIGLTLLAGAWRQHYLEAARNPVLLLSVALGLMFWLGCTYSVAGPEQAINIARKYSWLFYPFILYPVFSRYFHKQQWQQAAYISFIIGCMSIAFIAIARHWFNISLQHFVTTGVKLPFGSPLALAAFIALHNMCHHGKSKLGLFYLVSFVILTYGILFAMRSRTGYIGYFLLIALFALQAPNRKRFAIGAGVLAAILLAASLFSNNFIRGITHAGHAVTKLSEAGSAGTSTGARVSMVKSGLILWSHRPFFGFGTGAYATAYNQIMHNPKNHYQLVPWSQMHKLKINKPVYFDLVTDPHNEYIMIIGQLGAVGLVLFLALLISMFYQSFKMPTLQRNLAQGFVIVFAAGCFTGAVLYHDKSYYFIMMMGLLFASNLAKNNAKKPQKIKSR